MIKANFKRTIGLLILSLSLFLPFISAQAEAIIADHTFCGKWQNIPDSIVASISNDFEILYVRSSHGYQIITGFEEVYQADDSYVQPFSIQVGDDLGHNGDTSWVPATRSYLENPDYNINMAMFSWCAGVSDNDSSGIYIYLNKMTELENDYPNVAFIYMTGHLDGGGPGGVLYRNNNLIREYCISNEKVLYDFADIESYDPDGNYYPDASDACEWCYDWCSNPDNECDEDCYCPHTHCFNCFQKGKAWWVMAACIEGWNPFSAIEGSENLPTEIFLEQNYPNPFNSSTIINYYLPKNSIVTIDIYNILGCKIETLIDKAQVNGCHQAIWIADDHANGIYFYKIQAGDYTDTKKMVFIK